MSNQVYGSEVQRLFAQYGATSFTVTPADFTGAGAANVSFTPDTATTKFNFDDSFTWGSNGIIIQKSGVYTFEYQAEIEALNLAADFRAEVAFKVEPTNVLYAKTSCRAPAIGGGSSIKASQNLSGSWTSFLPIGYIIRLNINNPYGPEPFRVLGTSRIDVARLL